MTVSKIFILSHSEVLPVLSSFIDPANIPKQYGGTLDFAWGQAPNLDPVIRDAAEWEGDAKENPAFPKGPAYWRPIDGGKRVECVAVGSVDKVERCVRVCTLPVAFPEGAIEAAVNGAAVPVPAVTTTDAKDAPAAATEPAPAPAASEPAALDPAAAAATTTTTMTPAADPVSPGEDEFKTPLGSPLVGATQELSLQDDRDAVDEKKLNGDAAVSEKVGETEAVPNGKPVVAS